MDLIHTNFGREIKKISASAPLESATGIRSDHKLMLVETELTHCHAFEWIRYQSRIITDEGKDRFERFFININWEKKLGSVICPHTSVKILHEKIESLNDICFPWKKRKIKSTDKP